MSKKRPFGITILSVIGFIYAVIALLLGTIFVFFGKSSLDSIIFSTAVDLFIGLIGIFLIVSGLIEGIISFGLWKMQKWAWYVAIGTYALSTIYALTQMNFVSLVIGGLMVYYLYSVRKKF